MRPRTPGEHLWVNTEMNPILQSRLNGAMTPHNFIT